MKNNYKIKSKSMNNKQNTGITLIALVITIIVLLILAGVAISSLTGENGLLERASRAKTSTEEAAIKDEIGLAYNAAKMDELTKGIDIETALRDELKVNVEKKEDNLEITGYKGYNAIINTVTGEITISGIEETATTGITINEFSIAGTPVEPCVPSGFTHTEGTKNTGYVIQDVSGNEFVWVPVDKNQKITIKVSCEENITEMKLYDPYGDEISLGTVSGKTYENTNITPTVNGGYNLKVTTASGSKMEMLSVKSLYAIDTYNDYWGSDEYINYAANEGYSGSVDDMISDWGYSSLEEYKIRCQDWMKDEYSEPTDTIDYAGRVATNGGFYVGRYEAGYEAEKLVIKANTDVWNYIYHYDALSEAKAFNTSASSSLLTGAAWDRTIGWLYETGNKTVNQLALDSETWGNYNSDIWKSGTGLIKTGSMNKTKANNIFDLAGNVEEWTTEKTTYGCIPTRRRLFVDWSF